MEVTRENLREITPKVIDDIKNCIFLSFDFELTGLNPVGATKLRYHDTLQDRYFRLLQSAQSFLPIQFGLTAVRYENNQYVTKSYNFYLFSSKSTRRFYIEPSSVEFLSNHNFNFNKVFYNGIPFVTLRDEEREILHSKPNSNYTSTSNFNNFNSSSFSQRDFRDIVLKEEDKIFLDENCQIIEQWLRNSDPHFYHTFNNNHNNNNNHNIEENNDEHRDLQTDNKNDNNNNNNNNENNNNGIEEEEGRGEVELPTCNRYYARILHQELPKRFPHLFIRTSPAPFNKRIMKISKFDQVNERSLFGSIIFEIVNCKKPLIGHNLLLDLLHFYHSFISSLPFSVEDFSTELLSHFPLIIDTKCLAEHFKIEIPFKSTSLQHVFSFFSSQPPNEYPTPPILSQYKGEGEVKGEGKEEGKEHDAAFDSYSTSFIFLKLCSALFIGEEINFHSHHLSPYINKFHLTKSDIFFDLSNCKANRVTSEKTIFFIANFEKSANLYVWFADFGKFVIEWISDSSVFLFFDRSDLTKDLILSKFKNEVPFSIQTFEEYRTPPLPLSPSPVLLEKRNRDDNKHLFSWSPLKKQKTDHDNDEKNNTNDLNIKENSFNDEVSKPKIRRKKRKRSERKETENNFLSSSLCVIS